jgi:hypothetical protein
VIGDGDVDLEHVGDRSQQTLGLSQRLVEYQAKREARLDGDRRVDRLTTPLRWPVPAMPRRPPRRLPKVNVTMPNHRSIRAPTRGHIAPTSRQIALRSLPSFGSVTT